MQIKNRRFSTGGFCIHHTPIHYRYKEKTLTPESFLLSFKADAGYSITH